MGKYSVGISTQNKILDCCRALFYKKGIAGTSYEEICTAAEVNRGLIPYYFKSKNNIATTIYQQFIESMEEQVNTLCGEDENLRFVTLNALLYDLMKRDKRFCLFYNEIESNAFWGEYTLQLQDTVLSRLADYNGLSFPPEDFRTIVCMGEGVERELVHGIACDFLLEGAWGIAVRNCSFILCALGLPGTTVQDTLAGGKELFDKYYILCSPTFSGQIAPREFPEARKDMKE